jgi:hypothetical protein
VASAVTPFVLGVLSRNRPDWVRRCVSSALATAGANLIVVTAFDDDPTGFAMMPEYPNTVLASLSPRHYYCAGMNELYGLMRETAERHGFPLDYFAVVNDDCEFLAPQWPDRMREFLDSHFPDGEGLAEFVGVDKCAHFASRAAFIDRAFDGKLAAPGYVMYCSDTELMWRAQKLGRYAYAIDPSPRVRVAVHYEAWDAVRYESRRWYVQDRALWDKRLRGESLNP